MFGKAFVAIAFAAIAYAQEPTIESPSSLTQCVPTLIKWAGGTAPYFISIIPGNQPSAAAIKDFGQQSGTQLTWTVDIAAGTSVTYKIVDSGGQTNYNSAVTINPGSDSCLNGASASSGAASGTAAAGGAVSAASASASSAVGGASSAAASATSAAASSAAGVASSARSMASSAASGAMASASSVRSAGASMVSGASASAASAATTSNAASPFAVADIKTGALAVFLGAMGLAAF